MKPSVGRIVHYKLSASDAEATNRRRVPGAGHADPWPAGAQAHVGNSVGAGNIVPLLITTVWTPTTVNGQAFLDGNDSLWVTSAVEGDQDGQWSWPARVE